MADLDAVQDTKEYYLDIHQKSEAFYLWHKIYGAMQICYLPLSVKICGKNIINFNKTY